MSKVLKIVALVASIGAAFATAGLSIGISAAIFSAIAVGASVGASLLSPKPKTTNSKENIDRLRASIDPRTPRKTMVGVTAMATDIRDEEFTDTQTYFHRFIVVAAHKVNQITEIWFDDKKAWSLSGGVTADFTGYLTVAPILEGSAANAINISARMGTTRRYTGIAYVHLRYKLTGNTSKTDSPFAQQITTRITIRGKGAYFYDPRMDGTVAGGVGAHRADNQATWAWSDTACRNPALALLFYLLGWKIGSELSVGKGIPMARIDLASFAVAANICDENVTKVGGGTEPRYRCDGVWSEGDQPTTVIDMLKASMNADLDDVDGKLRLTVFHNDLASIDADFTDADVLGDFEWQKTPPLDQSFNIVRGVYTDPSDNALYQPVDYPELAVASPDGIDRIETFDLPMVESAGQAQRLAQLRLMRQKFGGSFKADFQSTAWKVQKNSIIRLTFTPRGFVNKLFRVAEMEHRVDGVVPLVLREEDASIYGAPSLIAPVIAVASTQFNPALDPVIQGISDSSVSIQMSGDKTVAADYTGAVVAGNLAALVWTPTVTRAGATIRTSSAATYALANTYGGTFAVDNTAASATKGTVTISAITANVAGGNLIITVDGVAQSAIAFKVTKEFAAAPVSGSAGKTATWTAGEFVGINTTTYAAVVSPIKTVTLATGETLYGTAPLDYNVAGGGAVTRTMTFKWQYSVAASGIWSDFAAGGITGITATSRFNGTAPDYNDSSDPIPGTVAVTQSKASLAAGNYDVRLVAICSATGRVCTPSGTATVEAKV